MHECPKDSYGEIEMDFIHVPRWVGAGVGVNNYLSLPALLAGIFDISTTFGGNSSDD